VKDEIGATVSVQGTINVLPPNNPPIATNFSVIFIRGQPLTVSFEEILESATDPDGDTLTIVGFASVTTNGKAVSQTSDSFIILEPFSLGSFWCAIGDGRGGQTLINIYFTEENGLVTDGIGRFRRTADEVSFYITSPGATWRIERSEDPKGPWTEIGQVSTGTGRRGGTVEFKDPNPPVGRAFYRGRR
jgi:hypothetical protein